MPFFQFEADFVASLRCIPMQVRYNLDTCGVKLKLHHWHQLTPAQRQALVDLPCDTPEAIQHYRTVLRQWVQDRSGERPPDLPLDPAPAWLDATAIPQSVQEKAQSVPKNIALAQWAQLSPLQRFALIKLSRSGHENRNFLPACQEFGL